MGLEAQSRLYIVVAAGTGPDRLAEMLEASAAATVLIKAGEDGPLTAASARPLVEMAQQREVAALIEDDAQLARTLRADGVHLAWSKDAAARYAEARDILGTRYIVGIDVGRSRHDAMSLAEEGADYIGFGIPEHVEDRETAEERRRELISWWAEIFEVPCVAFDVATTEEAVVLARGGADFVAMSASPEFAPADIRKLAQDIADAASQREVPA